MRSPGGYTTEELRMVGDIAEVPESTIDPPPSIQASGRHIDDSEYLAESRLSREDFKQVWKLSQALKRKLTWRRWIDFALGALVSSIIWFIILLWLLKL